MNRTRQFPKIRRAILSSLVLAGPLVAQAPLDHRPVFDDPTGPAPIAASRKEPVVAFGLSLFIPFGTGSFYAGHPRHGVTHLIAGLFTSTVVISAGLSCGVSALGGSNDETDCALAEIGFWGFVLNWGWGLVSAVNDANAANRRASTASVGSVGWRPNRTLPVTPPWPPAPLPRLPLDLPE
jgi:hypothetical protein